MFIIKSVILVVITDEQVQNIYNLLIMSKHALICYILDKYNFNFIYIIFLVLEVILPYHMHKTFNTISYIEEVDS